MYFYNFVFLDICMLVMLFIFLVVGLCIVVSIVIYIIFVNDGVYYVGFEKENSYFEYCYGWFVYVFIIFYLFF